MQHLIRTYTVWELIYQIWDQQTANRVEQKKKKKGRRRKQVRASRAFFNHSVGIKATFDLLDTPTAPGVLQLQCIHMCHTNGLIIRLPSLMICVNRLFTTKRTMNC